MSSSKLYIGNIPKDLSEGEISTYFASISPHSEFTLVRVAKDQSNKAGFGFLKTGGHQEVKHILSSEHFVNGHLLKCEEYSGSEEPAPVRNSLRRRRLFIRNLKKNITDEEMFQFFSQYGELESAYSVKAHASTKSRSFGYVTFKQEEPALLLVKLARVTIKGIEISIHPFRKCVETAIQINPTFESANQIAASRKGSNLIGQPPEAYLANFETGEIETDSQFFVSTRPALARWRSSHVSSNHSGEPLNNHGTPRRNFEHSSGISRDDHSLIQNMAVYQTQRETKTLSYNLFGRNFVRLTSQRTSSDSSAEEGEAVLGAKRLKTQKLVYPDQTSPQGQDLSLNRSVRPASSRISSPADLDLWSRSAGNAKINDLAHSSKPTRRNYFHREVRELNHGPSNIEINLVSTPRPRWQAARSLEIPFSPNQQINSFPSVF